MKTSGRWRFIFLLALASAAPVVAVRTLTGSVAGLESGGSPWRWLVGCGAACTAAGAGWLLRKRLRPWQTATAGEMPWPVYGDIHRDLAKAIFERTCAKVESQTGYLKELRDRTGVVLTITTLAAAFTAAVTGGDGLGPFAVWAVPWLFAASVILAICILWSGWDWNVGLRTARAIRTMDNTGNSLDRSQGYQRLAHEYVEDFENNAARLPHVQWLFACQLGVLGLLILVALPLAV